MSAWPPKPAGLPVDFHGGLPVSGPTMGQIVQPANGVGQAAGTVATTDIAPLAGMQAPLTAAPLATGGPIMHGPAVAGLDPNWIAALAGLAGLLLIASRKRR